MNQARKRLESERARWLRQVEQALDEADRLVALYVWQGMSLDAAMLQARIAVARAEVAALIESRPDLTRSEIHPSWTQLSAWCADDVAEV